MNQKPNVPAQTVTLEDILVKVRAGEVKQAAPLIRQAVLEELNFQGTHVNLANAVMLAADWAVIERLLGGDMNALLTTGWIQSLAENAPVNAKGEPVPWFTYPAIDFLEPRLQKNWRVFEYGSGNSTHWWAQRVEACYAIEDNQTWFDRVRAQLPANAMLQFATDEAYIAAIKEHPDAFFDVVIVDGSHRNACAMAAVEKVKPSGMIVFDNADQSEFDASNDYLTQAGWYRIDFWGMVPSYLYRNCTTVYFRDPEILRSQPIPSQHTSSLGPSCMQVIDRKRAAIAEIKGRAA